MTTKPQSSLIFLPLWLLLVGVVLVCLPALSSTATAQVFVDPGGDKSDDKNSDGNSAEDKANDKDKPDKRTKKKRRRTCKDGKTRTSDTDGRCCWPGQVWQNGCIGIPTECPDGRVVDRNDESCKLVACKNGQERVDGTHCCWPRQGWSDSRQICVGTPDCPEGFKTFNETCVPTDPGHHATAEGSVYGTLIEIPAGSFKRGCKKSLDLNCDNDETPWGDVEMEAYEIDRTEVPVSAYTQCVDDGVCSEPETGGDCNWGVAGRDEHPINCVTWSQANAFCTWADKRLPTEAEWEKAARGEDFQTYPWGNKGASCQRANAADCGSGTREIGQLPRGASPWGALDMSGNVAEWVADWYAVGAYGDLNPSNPTGPDSGSDRVIRGGSFKDDTTALRTTDRLGTDPSKARSQIGFRCARTIR